MTIPHEGGSTGILVLRDDDHDDVLVLDRLRSDPSIEFVDRFAEQLAGVRRLLPQPDPDLLEEAKRWAYYPWRRMVVAILGLRGFRAVRLDRNRHLITAEEQRALHALRVGVVGLSAGHAIAYTLAAEGACGTLRLADFDKIELSNLNRVPVGVFDIGLNKAMIAARRSRSWIPTWPWTSLHPGSRRNPSTSSSTALTSLSKNATRWISK